MPAALAPSGLVARAAEMDDPLPLRSQLPFNLLFLAPTPRSARLTASRRPRCSVRLAYENTLAATDDLIRAYRQDDFATYGGRVTLPVLQSVASGTPGRTAFILDGETLHAVLEVRVLAARRLDLGLEVPLIEHGRGFLDPTIDGYHERLNLPDGGRPGFARDRFVAGYVGDSQMVFFDHPPGGLGLGDVTLSGRTALLPEGRARPALAAGLSVKLPTGSVSRLHGSGSADYGGSIALTKAIRRSTLHAGYSYTRAGDWRLAPGLPLRDIRSAYGACVVRLSGATSLVAQTFRTKGPFPLRSGSDLGRVAWEIALGARHRLPGGDRIEWALLENLDREHNAPDIGAFLGWSPRGGAPPPPARSPTAPP